MKSDATGKASGLWASDRPLVRGLDTCGHCTSVCSTTLWVAALDSIRLWCVRVTSDEEQIPRMSGWLECQTAGFQLALPSSSHEKHSSKEWDTGAAAMDVRGRRLQSLSDAWRTAVLQ